MGRFLRYWFCLTGTLALLAACSKDETPAPPRPATTAEQTVLLYMPGRALATYYEKNIEGIRKAVSKQVPGEGRILVCYQPRNNDKATLLEIYYDAAASGSAMQELKAYDTFDAASREDVARMLADVAQIAPARSYGLIVGCHGKAWVPVEEGTLSSLSTQIGAEDPWQTMPGAKPTRSFGDRGKEIDIADFAAAVEAQSYRFDYLIFDACFMANIETLYDLRRTVDCIIASPCEIMAAGFPYDRAIPRLFTQNGASHDLQRVCEEFYRFYNEDYQTAANSERSGCISMTLTASLEPLADVMRRIYADRQQTYDPAALQSYEGMPTHIFYDLGHYVTSAYIDAALLAEFEERMNAAFPAASRLHTPSFYSAYNSRLNPVTYYSGVSTSEPSTRYRTSFGETSWYRATH